MTNKELDTNENLNIEENENLDDNVVEKEDIEELETLNGANDKNIEESTDQEVEENNIEFENEEAYEENNNEYSELSIEEYDKEVINEETSELEENYYEDENSEESKVNNFFKNNKNYLQLFLTIFTAFSLGGLSVFAMQGASNFGKNVKTSKVATIKQEDATEETTIQAVSKAKDAVVSVVNYQYVKASNSAQELFSGNSTASSDLNVASNGSGVIYKVDNNTAYIVTNEHVISGAEKINVVLSNGIVHTAEVVGKDIWTDLAVLKISAENVSVVMSFADSNNVAVGETSLAIGSPLGVSLSNTVTKGIVSAVERQVPIDIDKDGVPDWYQTVIQTDAAINPGNSGGALINNAGELIGINQLKITNATERLSAEGIGFVIPANEVKLITEQLEKDGKVSRPAIGVQLVSVSTLNAELLKGTINYNGTKGAVIKAVEDGSAAERSGLQQYDVITKLNDKDIDGVADLRKYIFENTKIGETITLTYYRNGKEYATKLTLGKLGN